MDYPPDYPGRQQCLYRALTSAVGTGLVAALLAGGVFRCWSSHRRSGSWGGSSAASRAATGVDARKMRRQMLADRLPNSTAADGSGTALMP